MLPKLRIPLAQQIRLISQDSHFPKLGRYTLPQHPLVHSSIMEHVCTEFHIHKQVNAIPSAIAQTRLRNQRPQIPEVLSFEGEGAVPSHNDGGAARRRFGSLWTDSERFRQGPFSAARNRQAACGGDEWHSIVPGTRCEVTEQALVLQLCPVDGVPPVRVLAGPVEAIPTS